MAEPSERYMYEPGAMLQGTPYRVKRKLGAGGMGIVYEVQNTYLDCTEALKTIHPELVDREDIAKRMQREAQALSKLRTHRNIVAVLSGGVIHDRWRLPFFAMEMLHGRTLRDALRKGALKDAEAVFSVASQVLSALDEAHAHNIVHRDVKPENIFLAQPTTRTENPTGVLIKLLDFGIMAVLGGRQSRQFRGTLKYAAPEQLRGDPISPRTDIYATALVVYEMLAGRGPFDDIREWQLLAKAHLEMPPPPLSTFIDVPKEIDDVFMSALAKDPSKRPPTAQAFGDKLLVIKRLAASPGLAVLANKTEETLLTALDLTDRPEDAAKSPSDGSIPTDKTSPGEPPAFSNDTVEQPMIFGKLGETLEDAGPPGALPASPPVAFEPTDIDRNAATRSLDLGDSEPVNPKHGTEPIPKDVQFEPPASSSAESDEPPPSSTRFADVEAEERGPEVHRALESNATPPPSVVRSQRLSRADERVPFRRVPWHYVALGAVAIGLAFVSIRVVRRVLTEHEERSSASETAPSPAPLIATSTSGAASSSADSAAPPVAASAPPAPSSVTARAPAPTRRAKPSASPSPIAQPIASSSAPPKNDGLRDLIDPVPTAPAPPPPLPEPVPTASDAKRTITH